MTAKAKARRTYTDAERAEIRAQRAALIAQLDSVEVDEDSRTWERLTERYSHRNSMLILIQRPGTRGDVKAMSKWNDEGRKVRKGESGILILAPAGDRRNADVEIDDQAAKPGEAPRKLRFVWVRVFDRAQTEPLPADWKPRAAKAAPAAGSRTPTLDDFLA